MNNRLLDQCLPLFNQLTQKPDRKIILAEIHKLDNPELKYLMAIFIDEHVLNSTWQGRYDWMAKSLQLELLGEHTGGEAFFTKLTHLRQDPQAKIDWLELYYVCLQLGFQGKYRLKNAESLLDIKASLQHQIESIRKEKDALPFPNLHIQPPHEFIQKIDTEMPYWLIGLTTLLIIVFIMFGYNTAMNSAADASANTIKWEINHHAF